MTRKLAALACSLVFLGWLALRGIGPEAQEATGLTPAGSRPVAGVQADPPLQNEHGNSLEDSWDGTVAGAATHQNRSPAADASGGGTLHGEVRTPRDQPAAGATVQVVLRDTELDALRTFQCETDAQGRFSFGHPSDFSVTLRASQEGFATSERVELEGSRDGPTEQPVVIELQPAGSLLVELDLPPQQVSGRSFTLMLDGLTLTERGSIEDSMRFAALVPGDYTVRVALRLEDGYYPLQLEGTARVEAGKESVLRLGTGRLWRVRGHATLDRKPRAGISLSLGKRDQYRSLYSMTTGDQGSFELLTLHAPPFWLQAGFEGRSVWMLLDERRADDFLKVELMGALVKGVVLDEAGSPRAGVNISSQILSEFAPPSPRLPSDAWQSTDDQGRFQLHIPHEGDVRLTWLSQGRWPLERTLHNLRLGQSRPLLELREPPLASVKIELRLPAGALPAQGRGPTRRVAVFDAQGRYRVTRETSRANGELNLELPFEPVRLLGFSGLRGQDPFASRISKRLDPGMWAGATFVLELQPACELQAQAQDSEGYWLEAEYRVLGAQGIDLLPLMRQGEEKEGSMHAKGLPPGLYRIEARDYRGRLQTRQVQLQPNVPGALTITFP